MGSTAVFSELERGDLAPAVPRLGGMARADGVVIVSQRYWAFAGVDGSLREGAMPRRASRFGVERTSQRC